MSDSPAVQSLDRIYGVLAEALGRVGEDRAALFLATVLLDLIASSADHEPVAAAIARGERLAAV